MHKAGQFLIEVALVCDEVQALNEGFDFFETLVMDAADEDVVIDLSVGGFVVEEEFFVELLPWSHAGVDDFDFVF